jgi:hypothetical protein
MVRVGEFSDDVCDRLKLKVSMKVTNLQFMKKGKAVSVTDCGGP